MSNKTPPILVPHSDWDKSADSLKWLSPTDYSYVIDLTANLLDVLSWARSGKVPSRAVAIKRVPHGVCVQRFTNLVEMWRGYEWYLALYGMKLLNRQPNPQHEIYSDSTPDLRRRFQKAYIEAPRNAPPYWLGNKTLHESHQSWLIRHDHLYKRTCLLYTSPSPRD